MVRLKDELCCHWLAIAIAHGRSIVFPSLPSLFFVSKQEQRNAQKDVILISTARYEDILLVQVVWVDIMEESDIDI